MTSEGPMVARLRQALAGADETQIDTAAAEWNDGAFLLGSVRDALEHAKPTMARNFGKNTRADAVAAFDTMIAKVEMRRQQMEGASTALVNAKGALEDARKLRDQFDANPLVDPGPFKPDPTAEQKENNDAEAAHSVTRGNFMEAFNARETAAENAYRHMDTTYTGSSETLRKIHGEPDRPAGGGGGAGGSGGSGAPGGGSTGPGGSGTPTRGPQWSPPPGDPTWVPHPGNGNDDPGGHPTPTVPTPGIPTDPGVPQGPGLTPTAPGSTPLTPTTVPTGSTPGALGGVAGALGGGLIGGMAGIGGAVRGGGVTAVPSSASGARPIGSTSRTGASGALGRGAASAGSPTSRTGTQGGSAGRGGAAGATRGAAGAGAPGGRAGTRGSGARAGAVRGTGVMASGAPRKGDKDKKKEQEFFEDVQDWIDDEGAAPGVID